MAELKNEEICPDDLPRLWWDSLSPEEEYQILSQHLPSYPTLSSLGQWTYHKIYSKDPKNLFELYADESWK